MRSDGLCYFSIIKRKIHSGIGKDGFELGNQFASIVFVRK